MRDSLNIAPNLHREQIEKSENHCNRRNSKTKKGLSTRVVGEQPKYWENLATTNGPVPEGGSA